MYKVLGECIHRQSWIQNIIQNDSSDTQEPTNYSVYQTDLARIGNTLSKPKRNYNL